MSKRNPPQSKYSSSSVPNKEALLASYLRQQKKNPSSYSFTSKGAAETVASASSTAASSVSTSNSNWQSQRYSKLKARCRQSSQANKKQNENSKKESTSAKRNDKAAEKVKEERKSHVLKDVKNSPRNRDTKKDAKKKHGETNSATPLKSKVSPKKVSHKPVDNSKKRLPSSSSSFKKEDDQVKSKESNESIKANKEQNDKKRDSDVSPSNKKSEEIKRRKSKEGNNEGEKIERKQTSHSIVLDENDSNSIVRGVTKDDLKEDAKKRNRNTDDDYEEFINDLKQFTSDHTTLFHSFRSIMHREHNQVSTPASINDNDSKRKKKRKRIATETLTRLDCINKYLRRKVRKSHYTNISQAITDTQLSHENDNNHSRHSIDGRSTKIDDSSSLVSKHSTSTSSSSSSTSRGKKSRSTLHQNKENGWKVKKIYSSKGNDDNERDNNRKKKLKKKEEGVSSLPKVIDVAQSTDPESIYNDDNDSPSNSVSASIISQRSMRPPLPPNNANPKDSDDSKKSAIPLWLAALREKQKSKKREERIQDGDDDNKSVNTVDLEKSAVDAIGKKSVLSIFGPLVHRAIPKPRKTEIESEDGNPSPWAVKLKHVNRESMSDFTPRELLPLSPHELKSAPVRQDTSITNARSKAVNPLSSISNQLSKDSNKIKYSSSTLNCSISPGDVIDLKNLPKPEFKPHEKPIIVPITNNNDNRCQFVVLGKETLLIASRCVDGDTDGDICEESNVLWYTARTHIVTIALNNKADGVLISIEDGTSFPLNFENSTKCMSFVQTYYNQSLTYDESHQLFTTPTSSKAEESKIIEISEARGMPANPMSFITPSNQIDFQTEEKKSDSSKSSIANMLEGHLKKQAPTRNDTSKNSIANILEGHLKKTMPTANDSSKSNTANILEGHLKEKITPKSDSSKIGIANMLEGHFKKQILSQTEPKIHQNSQLTDEEEVIASKYRNMLNLGMPKEAVSHAMKRDQVPEKVIIAITECTEIKSSTDSNLWSKEEERIICKFRKMLKINVSREAVRNKMTVENVDNKIIEAVLGKVEQPPQHQDKKQPKSLSSEDESIAEKYKKMLKVGLPREAVQHKMRKENVSNSIFVALFGPTSVPQCEKRKAPLLTEEEKQDVEKYQKMLKFGLPSELVEHDMKKMNVSDKVISVVLNKEVSVHEKSETPLLTEEEQKDVEKYQKMLKFGLPSELVEHDMKKMNVSDKVMSVVLNKGVGTSVSRPNETLTRKSGLVPIHWDTLTNEQAEKSIWSSISKKPKMEFDLESLSEHFAKAPKKIVKRVDDDKKGKNMAGILDQARAQNLSITLNTFKQFSLDCLIEIIADLDPNNHVKGDDVFKLSELLPKDFESAAIRKYKGEDDRLIPTEIFFRKLQSVPRVPSKIGAIKTMETFQPNIEEIISQFGILSTTCNNVMKSEKLSLVLESVLSIGNIMNEGTRSGDAAGIKIDSLLKLAQTKSKDKKMSVLDYIVMVFVEKRKERDVLDLSSDFPESHTASRIKITDTYTNFRSLESSLKDCKTELSKMKNDLLSKGKQFSSGCLRLEAFMKGSEAALSQVQSKHKQASKACKDLSVHFGEDAEERNATDILIKLTEFTNDMKKAMVKYDRLKEQDAKKEARKRKAAESAKKPTQKSLNTPSRKLFQTPSTSKKNEADSAIRHDPSKPPVNAKKMVSENKANNPRQALMDCIANGKQSTPSLKNARKSTEVVDPRKTLFQDIHKRKLKSTTSQAISNNQTIKEQEHDESSTLQSIIKKEANNTLTPGDMRKAMLQSISNRKPIADQKHAVDPRQALLQEIGKQKVKKDDNKDVNNKKEIQNDNEGKRSVDPRQAMLQAITKRQRREEPPVDIGNQFPTDPSNQLLRSILERKSESINDEKDSTTQPEEKKIEHIEFDDQSVSSRSVLRSKRSLGCGIVPDWECAITTFEPS